MIAAVCSAAVAGSALAAPPARHIASIGALHLSYPARFDRRSVTSCEYRFTGVHGSCVRSLFIASRPLPAAPERPGWQFRTSEVAFELYRAPVQRSGGKNIVATSYSFPLSLDDFHIVGRGLRPLGGRKPRPDSQLELFFRARGHNYWAIAWISAGVGRPDRSALASIVASVEQ